MRRSYAYALLPVAVIAVALLCLYFLDIRATDTTHSTSLEQRQQDFVEYADTVQLDTKQPVFEGSRPLCPRSDSSDRGSDCTLSKTFIYKLDGNYRDEGTALFSYLKTKGFDFRQDSKYKQKVEDKLRNTKLADNLSDSEPIIVDLYNDERDIRVRVHLGDYGRTMSYAKGQGLNRLSSQQLIAGLQFYNP